MVYRGLYPLLLEALKRSTPDIAQDDPAEVARRYPQSGVPDGWHSEAQTRFPPPVDVPSREERRLSLDRFAAEALASGGSNVQSSPPDYLWTAPPLHAGPSDAYAARPPWGAPPSPPVLPGRKFWPNSGAVGTPKPSPLPSFSTPTLPEWLRTGAAFLHLYPEMALENLARERGGKKFCRDRWEEEYNRCDKFVLPKTMRWRDACRDRAGNRLRLCNRNKGKPDPGEPAEYSWDEVPSDPAER